MVFTHTAGVFAKGDIQRAVHGLNSPVRPNCPGKIADSLDAGTGYKVTRLNTGFLSRHTGRLDHSQRTEILPVLSLRRIHPGKVRYQQCSSGFMSAVIFLNGRLALDIDAAPAKFLVGHEEIDNRFRQPFLVVFDGEYIIATLINNGCGYISLATQGVQGDNTAVQDKSVKQGADRFEFVAFACRAFLTQGEFQGCDVGADQMKRRTGTVLRATSRLSVQDNDVANDAD